MNARIVCLISILCAVGCSATIIPPAAPLNPVPVAVADYGRHASLIVPDASGKGSVEYAFGDWNWFAAGKNTPCDAAGALLASGQATLGRNTFPVTPDSPRLAKTLKADRIIEIECSADRVEALRRQLDERFNAGSEHQVYSSTMNLYFVPDDERYRLWNNCNHVTAGWLRELGCEIKGAPYTSKFKLAQAK